jgi:protein subunit release factor A
MNAVIIEIRAAEGGQDSKLLVVDTFNIYTRLATRQGL